MCPGSWAPIRISSSAAGRTTAGRNPSICCGRRAITVNGARALSECNVAILVRQAIDGVEVDLTSYGRFVDRLERRDGRWRIVERATIYEQDRLDPVLPSPAFDALMQSADAARFPAPYRYMGYRVEAAGRSLAEPVHYDGRAETEALKARYADWLAEK